MNKKIKNLIFIILSLIILAFLEFKWIIWHTKIFTIWYNIEWLDISHHQWKINWEEVKNEKKYTFVYMKATEWHDFIDKKFEYNWEEAKKNNFYVGAYHFFSMRSSWKKQAEKFIWVVKKEEDSLPPVIDVEIASTHDVKKVEKNLLEMSKLLEKHYWKIPILYVTYDSYNLYIKNSKLENKLWFRDILKRPSIWDKKWLFWQYSNRWHVNWIDWYVDKNVFYWTKEELEKYKDFYITDNEKAERFFNTFSKELSYYRKTPEQLNKNYEDFKKLISLNPNNPEWYKKALLLLPFSYRNTEDKELLNKSYKLAEKIWLEWINKFCNQNKINLVNKEKSLTELYYNKDYQNTCIDSDIPRFLWFNSFFYLKDLKKATLFKKMEITSTIGKKLYWNTLSLLIYFRKQWEFEVAFTNLLKFYKINWEKSEYSSFFKLLENTEFFEDEKNIEKNIKLINDKKKKLLWEYKSHIEIEKGKEVLYRAVRTLNLYYLNYFHEKYKKDTWEILITPKELKNVWYINYIPEDYQYDSNEDFSTKIEYEYSKEFWVYDIKISSF